MADQPTSPINPYASSAAAADQFGRQRRKPSGIKWAACGFLFGVGLSAAFGFWGLYQDSLYAATLPDGSYRCGMGRMAAMMFIFPLSIPAGGFFALIGSLASMFSCFRR